MIKKILVVLLLLLIFTSCNDHEEAEIQLAATPSDNKIAAATTPSSNDGNSNKITATPTSDGDESNVLDIYYKNSFATPPFNELYNSIPGDELSDEQIAEISNRLIHYGCYLLSEMRWECRIDEDDYVMDLWESGYDGEEARERAWHRSRMYSTMQELQDAVESTYSLSRSEQDIYERMPNRFKEIDGVLRRIQTEGAGSGVLLSSHIISVVSKEPERIVVRTKPGYEHPNYPEFVDLTIIHERGKWVLDSSLSASSYSN